MPDGLQAMNDRGLRSTVCTRPRSVIEAAAAAERIQVFPNGCEPTVEVPLLPGRKAMYRKGRAGAQVSQTLPTGGLFKNLLRRRVNGTLIYETAIWDSANVQPRNLRSERLGREKTSVGIFRN